MVLKERFLHLIADDYVLKTQGIPEADGQLAWDCLNSVPLVVDDAVRLVESIRPFLAWQSST